MRGEDHKRLTWEDATERFLDVTEITAADRAKPLDAALDTLAYNSYNLLTGAEPPGCHGVSHWATTLGWSRQGGRWQRLAGIRMGGHGRYRQPGHPDPCKLGAVKISLLCTILQEPRHQPTAPAASAAPSIEP